MGRFEKFRGLEDIWNIIKKEKPDSKFVAIGRASSKDMKRLHDLGIDHKGIVSEEEKFSLYSRAKVFIFPSMFEGFGIAITEAFAAGLSVIARSFAFCSFLSELAINLKCVTFIIK